MASIRLADTLPSPSGRSNRAPKRISEHTQTLTEKNSCPSPQAGSPATPHNKLPLRFSGLVQYTPPARACDRSQVRDIVTLTGPHGKTRMSLNYCFIWFYKKNTEISIGLTRPRSVPGDRHSGDVAFYGQKGYSEAIGSQQPSFPPSRADFSCNGSWALYN